MAAAAPDITFTFQMRKRGNRVRDKRAQLSEPLLKRFLRSPFQQLSFTSHWPYLCSMHPLTVKKKWAVRMVWVVGCLCHSRDNHGRLHGRNEPQEEWIST